jgi:hypothetical protein
MSSLNPFSCKIQILKWGSKFRIFTKLWNSSAIFHGRTMAMAAMDKVSAGEFPGVSFHLRTCPPGVASVLCKKTPIFGSRRSKLDHLTVYYILTKLRMQPGFDLRLAMQFGSFERPWEFPLIYKIYIIYSFIFERPWTCRRNVIPGIYLNGNKLVPRTDQNPEVCEGLPLPSASGYVRDEFCPAL